MMRLVLLTTLILSMLIGCLLAYADTPAAADEGPTPAWVTDASPVAGGGPYRTAAPPTELPTSTNIEPAAEPSAEDLIRQVVELEAAVRALRAGQGGKQALWFALLAALTYLLMTLVKIGMARREFDDEWKRWLAVASVGLGVAVGFFEAYTGDIATALLYGAGPPMAVVIREVWSKWFKKEPA